MNNYKIIDGDSVEQIFRSTETLGVHTPHHFVTGTVSTGALTDTELRATPVPISGTVSTGALTDTELRATALPVSGPLTDTQLRATPITITGTVSTGTLTDTQLRATPITITGALTDTQLRATPVPISGSLTNTELRATPVAISGALTNTELRATPVPISGTVATGALTNTQLRATALPVSGPLTNTELRATPVPISGTVATGALTDAELRATPIHTSSVMGEGDITLDAWGIQKVSLPISVFRGSWTYDISPKNWFMYENGTQVYTSTNIISNLGRGQITATPTASTVILESRLAPRYQPNRGHLFSTALWCPSKTADGVREWGLQTAQNGVFFRLKNDGKLYAVRKSGGVENYEAEIVTTGVTNFDVEKGNVYDIQTQWRGVGNYKFYINLTLVHTIASLGTLTALTVQNPSLPASFKAVRTTADVAIYAGCCDITSENGIEGDYQFDSATVEGLTITGTNVPVLTIYNPLTVNTFTNTRTVWLKHLVALSSKKAIYKMWRFRNPALITGATFVALGNGSFVQTDSTTMAAGAVKATAATVASMEYIGSLFTEANVPHRIDIGHQATEISLVRGDYFVITTTASAAANDLALEWGEEV